MFLLMTNIKGTLICYFCFIIIIIIIYKTFIAPMLEFRALYSYMNKKIN